MAFEVSNSPDANPQYLTEEQIWLAIMDGRVHREALGPAIQGCQAFRSWGYTSDPSDPKNRWAHFVLVIYSETPGGDWFVRYARRATPQEEQDYG